MNFGFKKLFIFLMPVILPLSAYSADDGFVFEGNLLTPPAVAGDPPGPPITSPIDIKAEITDDSGCVLYSKVFSSVDPSDDSGFFIVSIDGSGAPSYGSGVTTFASVFGSGTFCGVSKNSTTPRYLSLSFSPPGAGTYESLSNIPIKSVPFAVTSKLAYNLTPETDQNFGAHKILNVADPAGPQDAATKNYVDSTVAGAIPPAPGDASYATKGLVQFDTNAATSGISFSASGVAKLATTGVPAGTYTKVQVDTFGRVTVGGTLVGADIPDLSATYVAKATLPTCAAGQYISYNGTTWSCTNDSNSTYAAGAGLALAGSTFSANVDGSTLVADGTSLRVNDGGITLSKLALASYNTANTVNTLVERDASGNIMVSTAKMNSAVLKGAGANLITLQPPAAGSNYSLTLPGALPGSNQFLQSDNAGNLSWATAGAGGTVTNVTGTAPISVGTGSTTPSISIAQSNTTSDGYLSSADWNTFNNKLGPATAFSGAITGTYNATSITNGAVTAAKLESGTNGQLFIGNGTGFTKANLTAGSNVTISNSAGAVTINALGGGTVSSVDLTVPAYMSVSGGPITTSGTLTLGYQTQSPNTFFAAPDSASGAPSFRTLASGDLPVVPISKGGTGSTSLAGEGILVVNTGATAVNSKICALNEILKWNGTSWACAPDVSGSGTVTNVATGVGLTGGPITTTGTIALANTPVTAASYGSSSTIPTFTVDQTGRLTAAGNTAISINASAISTGILPVANGGTNSSAALNNNRVMFSSGGAITEMGAMTAGKIIVGTGATSAPSIVLVSGDATLSAAGAMTLANTSVTSGSYGSSSTVPTFTVDSKGRLTAVSNTAIAINASAISGILAKSQGGLGVDASAFAAKRLLATDGLANVAAFSCTTGQAMTFDATGYTCTNVSSLDAASTGTLVSRNAAGEIQTQTLSSVGIMQFKPVGQNVLTLNYSGGRGLAGINNPSPGEALDVSGNIKISGQMYNTVYDNSTTTIDWNKGNIQTYTGSGTSFSFVNTLDGGRYTLIINPTATNPVTFSAAGLTLSFEPSLTNAPLASGTPVSFNLIRAGTNIYGKWTHTLPTGFIGASAATNGLVGGWPAVKSLCSATFVATHMCDATELITALQNGTTFATSLWYADNINNCSGWNNTGGSGATINSGGVFSATSCSTSLSVACCRN